MNKEKKGGSTGGKYRGKEREQEGDGGEGRKGRREEGKEGEGKVKDG